MDKVKNRAINLVVSVFVLLLGVILSEILPIKEIPLHIFVYIVAYFIAVAKDIMLASKNIKQAKLLEENFLVIAVSILAAYMGEYLIAFSIAWLYSLGEVFSKGNVVCARFRKNYTLIATAGTAALAVIPVFFGIEYAMSFKIAVSVFVVICPLMLTVLKAFKQINNKKAS